MKILVTGADGYLGKGIVKRLLDDGIEVVATGFDTSNVDDRAHKISVNLFTVDDPYNYFGQPDALLHLAWRDGFVHNSAAHLADLPKHYEFLKKMVDSNIKMISIMGSMHEIGFYEGSIDENTACNPMNLYGISKNALRESLEVLINSSKSITKMQWLRGYYIVGNSRNGASIFAKIAEANYEKKQTFPFTSGKNQYDFLDYDTFCNYVAKTVEQDKVDGIINICSGWPESLGSRVEKFIKDNDYSIKLEYGAFPDRPYDSKAVWGNNKKILEIINATKRK